MRLITLSAFFTVLVGGLGADTIAELFKERLKSIVAVEFVVQTEVERRPVVVLGSVIDSQGRIIVPNSAIAPGVAATQLKDFRVYRPHSSAPFNAVYLGQDALTGWHFLQVEEQMRHYLVPISAYAVAPAQPELGEEFWGFGLRSKEEDFAPYFQSGKVGLVTRLPQKTAIFIADVAGPGLPVFNQRGDFAGLTLNSFGQNYLVFSRTQNGSPVLLVNVDESSVMLTADEVLPQLSRIPASPSGRPIAWLGAYGLQPIDPAVAKFLNLGDQSGVVLSDIMEGSPAHAAGLKDRDIVLAVDGVPLPRLKPDGVVLAYLGQQVLRRIPGDKLVLTVFREGGRLDITVQLGDEPKMVREADRKFYERLGFTAREFLNNDRIIHRTKPDEQIGFVVHFVRPNSPAAAGGLRPDDWVREIDGEIMRDYAQIVGKLDAIEARTSSGEFVLLVSRGGETSVLRIKIN